MSGIKGTPTFPTDSCLSSHYLILLIGSDLVFGIWSKVVVVNFDSLADFPARLSDDLSTEDRSLFTIISLDSGFEIHERRELTTV